VSQRLNLSRRAVIAGGAGAVAVARTSSVAARPADQTFQHGVASGDPLPRAVVLWTRVTPTPDAAPGSGAGPRVTVTWEVATDPRFRHVVRRGRTVTGPARDHTVKVDATRLRPDAAYFYRFTVRGVRSPVGRTRTAPARNAAVDGLRFGVVSCANLQAGWFSAYRHLAARDDLFAVIHLGDYLYEYGPGEYGYGRDDIDVRPHVPAHEVVSLADYRQRHAQYKADPDLRALHARHPFIVTWDDHEVTNDQWRDGAENHQPEEGDYAVRRAAAHQAYDEWMPVRLSSTAATGDGTQLFRSLRFGALAELSMLDLRSHRDRQADAPAPSPVPSPEGGGDGTITGRGQLDWLKQRLRPGGPQWKLVGNPVMIAPVTFAQLPHDLVDPVNDVVGLLPRDGAPYNVDQWDGYTRDRRELFDHIRDQGLRDVVFLTGDIHSGWACDLPHDASTYPLGDSAGVELVCTSVTSNNLKDITGSPARTSSLAVEAVIQTSNRHVKYLKFDDHGYSVLDVTPERVQMDWYVIGDRADRNAGVRWSASWATRSGTNTVQAASAPVRA
jgi:alkaline phosphatase D